MNRTEIKRRPLADTTRAGLEPESATYREQDGNGLYSRGKANGQKKTGFEKMATYPFDQSALK